MEKFYNDKKQLTNNVFYGIISLCKVEIGALSEKRTGSCLFYEKLLACGVGFAFRCCKKNMFF